MLDDPDPPELLPGVKRPDIGGVCRAVEPDPPVALTAGPGGVCRGVDPAPRELLRLDGVVRLFVEADEPPIPPGLLLLGVVGKGVMCRLMPLFPLNVGVVCSTFPGETVLTSGGVSRGVTFGVSKGVD